MRWKMRYLAVATLVLVTAYTVLAAGGRQRGPVDRQQAAVASTVAADNLPETPSAVQCSSCLAHDRLKSLSIELIKDSILNKLGMERPPEFGGRRPPKVPADLPPLKDLMRAYNDRGSVLVRPHIRHKSHHTEASSDGGGGTDMQSDEAPGNAAPPTATTVPVTFVDDDDDEDDYHMKTHKLIAFAQPHPTTPKLRGHHLLYFTFSEKTSQHQITKAVLWVYKKRTTTELHQTDQVINLEVNRIHPVTMHPLYMTTIKRVINTTEPTWVSINLQRHMADWFDTTNTAKNLTLMVHASYVHANMTHAKTPFVTDARKRADMMEIPYLEVHTVDDRRSRAKRNAGAGLFCNETSAETRCCRYPLTVNFEDFGWHWIIAPKTYVANYCSGTCDPMLFTKYPHTHLVQMTKFGVGPCCAPRKMSAISMVYFDVDLNIVYGILPGMVVDRCGCS
ncbi:growth/differentiation factor 8 isoform X2 [Adelges cooleyi]|uniref:growth/differentiation factor 8 isoform X2 n=1 Tax=Adelges cooleyi TaxID=133065 RepID=UPI00217FE680|nr:growth/differentiation factor 8 isoform X2 [Adelges cooleyi]